MDASMGKGEAAAQRRGASRDREEIGEDVKAEQNHS